METRFDFAHHDISCFKYMDYRVYLKDLYAEKKRARPTYSYAIFARTLGLKSGDLLRFIMNGKRNLSPENALRVGKACTRSDSECEYFLSLVRWCQATSTEEKDHAWHQLVERIPSHEATEILNDQLELLTHWWVSPLLEMTRLPHFKRDSKWIATQFAGSVHPSDIEQSLKKCVEKGLLTDQNGRLELNARTIKCGGDISSTLIQAIHQAMHRIGCAAISKVQPDRREYSSASMAVRKEDITFLKNEIRKFQQKLLEFSARCEHASEIYQINIQCFPIVTHRRDKA